MAKKQQGTHMILPGKEGFAKSRFCLEHNNPVKPVREFGKKSMMFHCDDGCKLAKNHTILRVPERTPTKRR